MMGIKFGKKSKLDKPISLKQISLITISIGVVIIAANFTLFPPTSQIFAVLNMVAAVIILGIPIMVRYQRFRRQKKLEEMFPKYLQDIASNISAGMTLPQAMKTVTTNEYGILSPHVGEIAAKISWGIPFEKAMKDFAVKTGSEAMMRNIQTIIETHKSGGTMDTILESVAQSLIELEKIKKERSASVYSQMINGYLIYVVFLGVMIGLSTVLVPAFRLEESIPDLQDTFVELFRALTVIQGFFAGLAIGKMAEGTLVAGVKHSLVLVVFGYSVFLIFL